MDVTIHKDPLALRFIRCVTPIPGTTINAGGAGITLQQALSRCESELIERQFEIHELWPMGIYPVGIAAHYDFEKAKERATQEAIETLCLKEIHAAKTINCLFRFSLNRITIGIARTTHGYFCLIRGFLNEIPVAAYTAARSFAIALIKAWEEFQSIFFYRPQGEALKQFSKAHLIFSEIELASLPFSLAPRNIYSPTLSKMSVNHAERSGRTIVYLHSGEKQ